MGNEEIKQTQESGGSPLNDGLGTAIFVDGEMVAWFAEFTEEASEWCTENHFGRWLTWRAKEPEIVPLTEEEQEKAMQRAKELAELFSADISPPNARLSGPQQREEDHE